MKKNESCCSCESDFKKEVKGLVDDVEKGRTKTAREKKGREVRAAFGEEKKLKKTGK